jgi:tetratricopeptide (TPR) repeat protein
LTPNAPRREDKRILGRDNFIADLCRELQEEDTSYLQLTGMGGIGKTKVLNNVYANFTNNRIEHIFDYIGLLNYSGDMDRDLARQILIPKDNDTEDTWEYLHVLCDNFNVLLLIDDIRPQQEEKGKPLALDPSFDKLFSKKATILLASRVLAKRFEPKEVLPLTIEECIQVFQIQRYNDWDTTKHPQLSAGNKAILSDIIEHRAGCNTLIVTRLGAMACAREWTIKALEQELKKRNFDIRKKHMNDEKLQEEINKLYSIKDIASPSERNILEAFALFPAIPLNVAVCVKWLSEDAGLNEDDCQMTLKTLSNLTWLTCHRNTDGESVSYSMHQMVRSAVITQTETKLELHTMLVLCCNNAISMNYKDSPSTVQSYMPFAINIASFFYPVTIGQVALPKDTNKTHDLPSSLSIKSLFDLMYKIGIYFIHIADFEQALKWLNNSLNICEKISGSDSIDAANVLRGIARSYTELGNYSEALEIFKDILAIDKKTPGADSIEIANTYNNIGFTYANLGNFSEALKWYERALIAIKGKYDDEHLFQSTVYNNIAIIFLTEGNYIEALKWCKKSLAIKEKELGSEHPDTAINYISIANIYIELENYTGALELLQKAQIICEKEWGTEHPTIASIYKCIAEISHKKKNFDEALSWYHKALHVQEKRLGRKHPDTTKTLVNIAYIYNCQKNYEQALELFREALITFEAILGAEHPYTRMIANGVFTSENKICVLQDDV